MLKGCGRILVPPLEKKTCQIREIWYWWHVAVQLWSLTHFNSKFSSEHCSWNQFNAVTKLGWMNVGWKNSSLTPEKAAKLASSDACHLCGVNCKISVGDLGGKNEYISTWKGWSWQNSPSRPFENTSWCWTGSTSWKIYQWTRNSFFLLGLYNKKQTDTIKIKTFWNSSEIYAILTWAAKWWMPLSVTRVVNALLCSDKIYCPLDQSGVAVAGATNAVFVNTRQSEAVTAPYFFRPFTPMFLLPHHPKPQAFSTVPSFACTKRPRWRPVNQHS